MKKKYLYIGIMGAGLTFAPLADAASPRGQLAKTFNTAAAPSPAVSRTTSSSASTSAGNQSLRQTFSSASQPSVYNSSGRGAGSFATSSSYNGAGSFATAAGRNGNQSINNAIPNSAFTDTFNATARKGHISSMPPAVQKGMREGRIVAAVPQRVQTPFITGATYNPTKYAPNTNRWKSLPSKGSPGQNYKQGEAFETEVGKLGPKGLSRPGKIYKTPYGKTRPDYKDGDFLIDAKRVNKLSNTRQMKAQRYASNGKHVVIAAPHTRLSKPMQRSTTEVVYLVK